MAPSVGLFDAMRVGPDTDPVWETPGESGSQPGLKTPFATRSHGTTCIDGGGSTIPTANLFETRVTSLRPSAKPSRRSSPRRVA